MAITCLALALSEGRALADEATKAQCIAANEDAQTLRRAGKWTAARARLATCLSKSCPAPVREDCEERVAALDQASPSVIFIAKGRGGAGLDAVRVSVDGAVVIERLTGAPLAVDPGAHTFEFTAVGYTPVVTKLTLIEGVKGRQEVVDFGGQTNASGIFTLGKPGQETPSDAKGGEAGSLDFERQRRGTLLPWLIGGAVLLAAGAVVGGYFLLKPEDRMEPPSGKLGSVTFAFGR